MTKSKKVKSERNERFERLDWSIRTSDYHGHQAHGVLIYEDFQRKRQHSACVSMASPWHARGHCKVKCSLCSAHQVWCSLHWGLRQGWAGGLWGLRFCRCVEISRRGGSTHQPQRTEPCRCVSGQLWACHGALQGQMQPLQCAPGVVGLHWGCGRAGQVVVGVAVFAGLWVFPDEEAALGNHSV